MAQLDLIVVIIGLLRIIDASASLSPTLQASALDPPTANSAAQPSVGQSVTSTSSKFLGKRSTVASSTAAFDKDSRDPVNLVSQFEDFKVFHQRVYKDKEEEAARFKAFTETAKVVVELNTLNGGDSIFGISHFADLFEDEVSVATSTGFVLHDVDLNRLPEFSSAGEVLASRRSRLAGSSTQADNYTQPDLPEQIDWRRTRAITPIKSQGSCGDCWAFSVAEEVEAMYVIYVDDTAQQIFSPQQITSCTPDALGCGGGHPIQGYEYLMEAPGLAQEVFWPFAGGLTPAESCKEQECTQSCKAKDLNLITQFSPLIGPYARVKNGTYAITPCQDYACENQDLHGLALAVATVGPLSVAVNSRNWRHYKGGVMSYEACGNSTMNALDHAVQLVGFNQHAEKPYWIVRNSWSTQWGDNGYIFLEYGKNTCGIANFASYPELHTQPELGNDLQRRLKSNSEERFARLYMQATGHAEVV